MTDLEIALSVKLQPIEKIAAKLHVPEDRLERYGKYKAKLPLDLLERKASGKLVLMSAISPTPPGEGKTTTSVGLTEAMNLSGRQTTVVLREPSLGPVFGMKGGAAGGGYAQVVPMEDINLHFTGDFAAIEKANNLLAALIDNEVMNANSPLRLNPRTILHKRVMDMNDRSLRQIVTGLGGAANGVPREAGFNITAASEVMAILCMCADREDLKRRLGDIYVGRSYDKRPIYARDLKAQGAMAVLLKDAIKPNLVQTLEGNPAILHGGPFANIAQGTNTLIATRMGLALSDYVVTEAGFGFDLGGEKFLDIKCRAGKLSPDALVLVATIRALKFHGGMPVKELKTENVDALKSGLPNMVKHIENAREFGLEPIIALNHFDTDTEAEIAALEEACREQGVKMAICRHFAEGGRGALHLADLVAEACEKQKKPFQPAYELQWSIREKINAIATRIYGADDIELSPKAETDAKRIEQLGLSELPVCIAKTQYSFSDNPQLVGRPTGHTLHVREIELAAGAGFVIPICGELMRMPGLPPVPAAAAMDIDADGRITGLS